MKLRKHKTKKWNSKRIRVYYKRMARNEMQGLCNVGLFARFF